MVHAHPAARGGPRDRQRVPAAAAAPAPRGVRLPSRSPIPSSTRREPYSKSFVLHLDAWYAQSHPDEDFAETFAVWLTPNSEWRQRYAGWPALKKLEYMDALMRSLRDQPPRVDNPEEIDPLRAAAQDAAPALPQQAPPLRRRLSELLRPRPAARSSPTRPSSPATSPPRSSSPASAARCGASSPSWTGIYQYTIDQVLEDMIARCRELKLRLAVPEDQARQEFTVLLTVQAMNYLHSGGHRLFL